MPGTGGASSQTRRTLHLEAWAMRDFGTDRQRRPKGVVEVILTFPTKVPSDSLGWIGSLKRTSDKSLFPMALGSCGHRITHQLRPINMNGRSILAVTSIL